MRQRCADQNHKHYHRYGGRGIRVCLRWRWWVRPRLRRGEPLTHVVGPDVRVPGVRAEIIFASAGPAAEKTESELVELPEWDGPVVSETGQDFYAGKDNGC